MNFNIKPNFKSLKCNSNEKFGIAKEVKPDIATIIIEIGLTILALTAASPKIKAPIIPDCSCKRVWSTNTCFLN